MKENERLQEIKLALCLNHIDKSKDKNEYSLLVKVLSCLAAAIGKEEHDIFIRMFQSSIGDGLMGATNKELMATHKAFYTIKEMSEKFNRHSTWYYLTNKDLFARNFINDTFLSTLYPKFNSEKEKNIIKTLNMFIDDIKFELGENSSRLCNKERTLEIEFYLIYKRLMDSLQNNIVVNRFIFNICNIFHIDYNSISQLMHNIYLIDRSFPKFKYNNRYFMQEICTLYKSKGLSLGTIGSKVLGKGTNYFYNNTNKEQSKEIKEEDLEWLYAPTLVWDNIDKGSVYKFIDIFHTFIKYNV